MKWIKVDFDLPLEDFIRQTTINGKKLCVVRADGEMYAVQAKCPHAGGNLSGGWCKNGNIICPLHRYEYSFETGKGAPGQGDYIDIYPTKIESDGFYIGFDKSLWEKIFNP